jgi:hypothetical protein
MEITIRTGINASQLEFSVNDTVHKILRINGSIEENLIDN